jgi:hypothetical protein
MVSNRKHLKTKERFLKQMVVSRKNRHAPTLNYPGKIGKVPENSR